MVEVKGGTGSPMKATIHLDGSGSGAAIGPSQAGQLALDLSQKMGPVQVAVQVNQGFQGHAWQGSASGFGRDGSGGHGRSPTWSGSGGGREGEAIRLQDSDVVDFRA
jgi:hypothetical protein